MSTSDFFSLQQHQQNPHFQKNRSGHSVSGSRAFFDD